MSIGVAGELVAVEEVQPITIATTDIDTEERAAAEQAATRAVAEVRRRRRENRCPGCGAECWPADGPRGETLFFELELPIPAELAQRAYTIAPEGSALPAECVMSPGYSGGQIRLRHECPAPPPPAPADA